MVYKQTSVCYNNARAQKAQSLRRKPPTDQKEENT